jgi:hypothetical protein
MFACPPLHDRLSITVSRSRPSDGRYAGAQCFYVFLVTGHQYVMSCESTFRAERCTGKTDRFAQPVTMSAPVAVMTEQASHLERICDRSSSDTSPYGIHQMVPICRRETISIVCDTGSLSALNCYNVNRSLRLKTGKAHGNKELVSEGTWDYESGEKAA